MAKEQDPLSQVYDLLWDLVEASPLVKSYVRVGNRIKFNDPSWISKEKSEVSSADLPEMILVVTQLTGRLRATSSSSSVLMKLEWLLSTGDINATRGILPLLWAIFAALANWPATSESMTWAGKTFVKRIDLVDATVGLTDSEKNRGVRGFSSIWACEVEMFWGTTDVIADSQVPIQ